MKPKKDLIKAAEADGSIDRLNSLLSAAHILNCEANMLVEEAADLMNAKGLLLGNVKRLHNNFVKSADLYFLEFSSLVETEKSKMDKFRIHGMSVNHESTASVDDDGLDLLKECERLGYIEIREVFNIQ